MTPFNDRWLHAAFGVSSFALLALLMWVVMRDANRPSAVDQRIVPVFSVVERCEACHDKHPGRWLEQHAPDRFGCTICHGGQGLATDAKSAHEASPDWLRPLYTKEEREAACGTCHLGAQPPQAERLARGRKALVERGCAGCHLLPGTESPNFAPDLAGLRDKSTLAVVRARLRDPALVDARHRMPKFALTDGEIEALVAYLWTLPGPELHELPTTPEGDADRGKSAVAQRRCATCHRIEGRGGETGPDLALAGMALQPRWLFNWLTQTHRLQPQAQMPEFRLSIAEVQDIVAYAAEQWVSDDGKAPWEALDMPVQATLAAQGAGLFAERGCNGCHAVSGQRGQPSAAALQRIGDRRIDDLPRPADGAKIGDLPSWIARKVQSPHAFDGPLTAPARMPQFARMTPEEALAIGIALTSLRSQARPAAYLRHDDPPQVPVPPGETGELFARFQCLTCHQLGAAGGNIARVPLDGAGGRLKRPWLERFLRDPLTIRLDQSERMPVLGLTEHEATLLANWLESAQGDDRMKVAPALDAVQRERGRQLYGEKKCGECHIAEGHGPMRGTNLDGACWRLRPAYVAALLRQGPGVVPQGRHPANVANISEADIAAVTTYVLSLPAAWPWASDAVVPTDCPVPATPSVAR
jgi:mono/diheme cytochrome c family protein